MNYNTSKPKLAIREYGRNIQKLIEHITDIKDKTKRTNFANAVINIMAQNNPSQKYNEEYRQKLFDHLFIISDYKIDIETSYSKPSKEVVEKHPDQLSYPKKKIRFRHYGNNIELMIKKAIEMANSEKKDALSKIIANYMKMASRNWNRESVNDDTIISDLEMISEGKLKLDKNTRLQTVSVPTNNNNNNRRPRNQRTNRRNSYRPYKKRD